MASKQDFLELQQEERALGGEDIVAEQMAGANPMRVLKAKSQVERLQHIEFNSTEKSLLASGSTSPFYQLILRLMEGEIEKAETEHFRAYRDREQFDRLGVVAVAMRIFFERVQTEIDYQRDEYFGEVEQQQADEELKKIPAVELVRRQAQLI